MYYTIWACNITCACWVASVVSDSLWPHGLYPARLLCPWDFPNKNTGVEGLNLHLLCLLHCRQMLYCWASREAPFWLSIIFCINFMFILKYSFIYLIALRLSCAMRDLSLQCTSSVAMVHGLSCTPAGGILVHPRGIEAMSPALQGGFLTTGAPGKSLEYYF